MSTRAKFRCSAVHDETIPCYDPETKESPKKAVRTVHLHPVYGDSEENKQFFASSPSGMIQLGMTNMAAGDQFAVGKEFYIDFIPA